VDADLQALRELLAAATLSDERRKAALQCVGQLPRLYRGLCETYESRYADEIARLVQAVCRLAAGVPSLAEAITVLLRDMQERLGIPGPDFKSPVRKVG
jgi:hypothetical protein